MQRRVEQDFGGEDPRMRHTGGVGSAVAAHVREEHGKAAPSHGRPPTQPQPDAEPTPERSPTAQEARRNKREEPWPQEEPHAGPRPEREARRLRVKRPPH